MRGIRNMTCLNIPLTDRLKTHPATLKMPPHQQAPVGLSSFLRDLTSCFYYSGEFGEGGGEDKKNDNVRM